MQGWWWWRCCWDTHDDDAILKQASMRNQDLFDKIRDSVSNISSALRADSLRSSQVAGAADAAQELQAAVDSITHHTLPSAAIAQQISPSRSPDSRVRDGVAVHSSTAASSQQAGWGATSGRKVTRLTCDVWRLAVDARWIACDVWHATGP